MFTAQRLEKIPPYLFMTLRNKINEAKARGVKVISLAIGDPVDPTPSPVIDELCRTAYDPENHRYPTDEEWGMRSFREAIANWYHRRYGVTLDASKEIVALIGSKEGCHHFALAVVNPGDKVLVTDPGYPGYKPSIWFAGGEPIPVPATAKTDFLPALADIPTETAKQAKAFYLNYPNNPTGAIATKKFLNELVEFCKSWNIAVCYDNPYSELVFEGEKLSFLSAEGAKDIGVELNSLSKPFNMTGWRIGMACGNAEIVKGIATVKANTDSGIFNAIQYAGIKALNDCDNFTQKMIEVYRQRREKLLSALSKLNWKIPASKGTFYLWAPVPEGFTSAQFCEYIFEKCAIVLAPGSAYGQYGEGYVRFSLTIKEEQLDEAIDRMLQHLKAISFK